MKVVVDGNDGTGKSTLVAALRTRGHDVADRGFPTKMTDDLLLQPIAGERYLILDAPVDVSRARLAQAGKDLHERFHTVPDLTYYRERFRMVAERIGKQQCAVIDAAQPPEQVLAAAIAAIGRFP
ncbi:hypothetical protein HY632_04290 [Candidatus Uhrbacteria bacterium]|nr:hypothetical protein [Candidatus Uhrbacteria bacterium]